MQSSTITVNGNVYDKDLLLLLLCTPHFKKKFL